ncbi:APC family permease [Kitasatospora sp. NPDC059571]|uniref:APC family permease n=1 Tax=Kitasatospora sp. NPDC059571 TaxID=3346871 RepID=UPI00369B20DB
MNKIPPVSDVGRTRVMNGHGDRPRGQQLSAGRVMVLAVSAAGPLGVVVGSLPLALALGNGPGVPATFVVAMVVQLCFCVGYAALCRRVVSTGGFYRYVGLGLGRPAGVGAAMLALCSYTAMSIGLVGAFGYFTSLVLAKSGLHVSWMLLAGGGLAVVGLLGYHSVGLSAKVLAVLLVAQIAMVAVYDLAVVAHLGAAAFPAVSFAPATITTGSLGLGLMMAFSGFAGYESAVLYGEESTDPTRSIPRAAYLAVGAIGLIFVVTSWITIGAIGADQTQERARRQLGNLMFGLVDTYASEPLSRAMAILMCTALLASMLAMHNAASRYTFALGRERLLPAVLGRFDSRRYSPACASLAQTAVTALAVAAFAAAGLDPYLNLATSMVGLSTLGILVVQAIAAVAIVVHFHRSPESGLWRTRVAPTIGAVGLLVGTVLSVANYGRFAGTADPVVVGLPVVLGLAVVGGTGFGLWLRSRRPEIYAGLAWAKTSVPDVLAPAPGQDQMADEHRLLTTEPRRGYLS